MKKIILISFILLPLCLNAQQAGKHHVEIGAGLAMPGEVLYKQNFTEDAAFDIYAAYRFNLNKELSVGATYSFVTPHQTYGDEIEKVKKDENGRVVIDSDGKTVMEKTQVQLQTFYQSLDAFAEYKTAMSGSLSFYAGLGGGMQCRYADLSVYYSSMDNKWWWGPDVMVYAGLEIMNHLRLTLGHRHDLHFPFKNATFSAAPYYYFNLGWSF